MGIFSDVTGAIGNTPLIEAKRLGAAEGVKARLLFKCEGFNPLSSVKDRAALYMLKDAAARGVLAPGGRVVEATSGNMGIGLAYIGKMLGYRVTIVMPDSMSSERVSLLRALGARVELTPGAGGMAGALERARELTVREGGVSLGQFENPANPLAHYETTGPELWRDAAGAIDAFVAGVGTGGTVTGVGRYLKERNPRVLICAVEPEESMVLRGGKAGPHGIQGIGANFLPVNFDAGVVDRVLPVGTARAKAMVKALVEREGIMAGISSGAAAAAAVELARELGGGKTVVALLPDSGERYISTGVFD